MNSSLTKRTDGIVARYLNRKISTRITRFIVRKDFSITPNQVSVISFILVSLAFPLFLLQIPLWAGILVQVGSVIDGVDGELARATGKTSPKGAFLDAILDRVGDCLALIGASLYALWRWGIFGVFAGLFALGGSLMVSYFHLRGEFDLKIHPATVGKFSGFASRDVRLFVLFLASIIDYVVVGLLTIAVLSFSYLCLKGAELYGELAAGKAFKA